MPIQGDKIVAPIGLATINNFLGTGEQSVTNIVVKALHGGTKVFDRTYTDPDTGEVTTVPFNTAFSLENGEILKDAVPFWNIWSVDSPGAFFTKLGTLTTTGGEAINIISFGIKQFNSETAAAKNNLHGWSDLSKFDNYSRVTPLQLPIPKVDNYASERRFDVSVEFPNNSKEFAKFMNNILGQDSSMEYQVGILLRDNYNNAIGIKQDPNQLSITIDTTNKIAFAPETIKEITETWYNNINFSLLLADSETVKNYVFSKIVTKFKTSALQTAQYYISAESLSGVYPYLFEADYKGQQTVIFDTVALDINGNITNQAELIKKIRITARAPQGINVNTAITGRVIFRRDLETPEEQGVFLFGNAGEFTFNFSTSGTIPVPIEISCVLNNAPPLQATGLIMISPTFTMNPSVAIVNPQVGLYPEVEFDLL